MKLHWIGKIRVTQRDGPDFGRLLTISPASGATSVRRVRSRTAGSRFAARQVSCSVIGSPPD
jgi:hypothetical protein